MRTTPYPIRRCKQCARPFSAVPKIRYGERHYPEHCSWDCAQATVRSHTRGKPLTAAMAARQAKRTAGFRRDMEALFGQLTDRELTLMQRAEQVGRSKGYQQADHKWRARHKAAAGSEARTA